MFRTVVVALDLTAEAERAVPSAATLAHQADATLEFLTVRPSYATRTSVREHLADVARRHHVDARFRIAASPDVAAGILQAADCLDNLICLQTHARRAVTELVLGSVSEQVMRCSRHPVLLVGPRCGPAPDRFEQMVVGLDGSEAAEQILPVATEWANRLDVTPWLLQVLEARVPLEVGAIDLHETAYVHRVAERLVPHGIKAQWDVGHDRRPAAALCRFAKGLDGSLIALTSHGRSGFGRLALGSVALDVAHNATVPVLVLRPHDAIFRGRGWGHG